jgi:GT2 family glycosyltransferase
MIYSNGKTNGYLRHHSVDDPRALIMRDVDYCSGVFLIFKKANFLELGGFDERYYPAYYEDTDFCMRLQKSGLRCIYNPELLVEHFEFGSAVSFSKRAMIKRNRHVFMEKWGEMLRHGRHSPSTVSTSNELAANRLLNL